MGGLTMKRVGNIYDKMISIENIKWTYNRQVRLNTKNRHKIYKFDNFYTVNLCNIQNLLQNGYKCGQYNIFLIRESKYRIIMSQQIKDKVINHLVGNTLIHFLDKSLIDGNIATRIDKGTHFGIKMLKKYLNQIKDKPVYALKFDISKYFYNIDHEMLKKLYHGKFKDKKFLALLDQIIDTTNADYVNYHIQKLIDEECEFIMNSNMHPKEKNKRLNELKKIPLYKKGKGLPIGNLTSQILAVFYLNELDHYIQDKMDVKYIRYMDDGVLLSNDKEYLKECFEKIKEIIEKYHLKLNNKTAIINVSKNGLDFLGFRFYIINNKIVMKLRTNIKRRFKRKMKKVRQCKYSEEKSLSIISSYRGHLQWGNCYNLLSKNGL